MPATVAAAMHAGMQKLAQLPWVHACGTRQLTSAVSSGSEPASHPVVTARAAVPPRCSSTTTTTACTAAIDNDGSAGAPASTQIDSSTANGQVERTAARRRARS